MSIPPGGIPTGGATRLGRPRGARPRGRGGWGGYAVVTARTPGQSGALAGRARYNARPGAAAYETLNGHRSHSRTTVAASPAIGLSPPLSLAGVTSTAEASGQGFCVSFAWAGSDGTHGSSRRRVPQGVPQCSTARPPTASACSAWSPRPPWSGSPRPPRPAPPARPPPRSASTRSSPSSPASRAPPRPTAARPPPSRTRSSRRAAGWAGAPCRRTSPCWSTPEPSRSAPASTARGARSPAPTCSATRGAVRRRRRPPRTPTAPPIAQRPLLAVWPRAAHRT